jgi:pantoate--beta-alanine ligase
MRTCVTIQSLRDELGAARAAGKRVGFVPTMGALHAGHLSLARQLREHCDVRVCSIFVNPTQFNDVRDYQAYVINLRSDQSLLQQEQVDLLFAPSVEEVYGPGFQSEVLVQEISKPFEGALRPGHFTGVATVVTLLLNIVRPDVAIFGEKDFQQLTLVERLVRDLKLETTIVRGALVRDEDGLALSSRNVRLTAAGRRDALRLSRGLFAAHAAWSGGERSAEVLERIVVREIEQMANPQIDYAAVVDESNLERVQQVREGCRILLAARVDGVRLLDNIALR